MVRVIFVRRDLGRTKNGDKSFKISIRVDFRVITTHINAYMLIFINKPTEITKIPEKVHFRSFPEIPDVSVRNLAEVILEEAFISSHLA